MAGAFALLFLVAAGGAGAYSQAAPAPAPARARTGVVSAPLPQTIEVLVEEAEPFSFPAPVDSNSASFRRDGVLYVFNSTGYGTYRSSGYSVDTLTEPAWVELPVPGRPGTAWIEEVWLDPTDNHLYGWYHFEPSDVSCYTTPLIGAAVSYDDGLTWEDRGFVLSNPYPEDCADDNGYISGGNGDFSVVLDRDQHYFYFLFSNYNGPLSGQGVAVARSRFEDRGQPGTVFKYFEGDWSQPGIDGEATALFASSTGWEGPYIESYWGPSVHWNTYLNCYVALLNHTAGWYYTQEGVYVTFSADLLHWSEPLKILETDAWYPQVIGLAEGESSTLAGAEMRLFLHGDSSYVLRFSMPSVGPDTTSVTASAAPAAAEEAPPAEPRNKPE